MLLFGAEGQKKLRQTAVAVVGVGGLGSALVQHLALLGVGSLALIDSEELDDTNRNRFIGARLNDPVPGSMKVDIAHRLVQETNPDVVSEPIPYDLVSTSAFRAVKAAEWVCGCFDDDGPRGVLNELCSAYKKPYVDLASDVPAPGVYGGRACIAHDGNGCLSCLSLLDRKAVRRYVESEEEVAREDEVYGIPKEVLEAKGPSVSPVNGVVASLAATELMVAVTGMRPPTRLQTYRGWESKVVVSADQPTPGCYYCKGLRGQGAAADVERYLNLPRFRDQSSK